VARPQEPDVKSIALFVKSPRVLLSLHKSAVVHGQESADLTVAELRGRLRAQMVGNSQLELTVRGGDPRWVAAVANEWAKVVTRELDRLYGVGDTAAQWLADQRAQANEKWSQAQAKLAERLPESQLGALQVELESTREALSGQLRKIKEIDATIAEARLLEGQFSKLPAETVRLPVGLAMALIGLQQQIALRAGSVQVELSAAVINEDFGLAQSKAAIAQLIEAFEEQRETVVGWSQVAQREMARLAAEVDAAAYEISRLKQDRDIAQTAYTALVRAEEDVRLVGGPGNRVATTAGSAMVPTTPIYPRPMLYAAAAAFLALMVALFVALYVEFWRIEHAD
jgi:uncharacterized protein involved in exopolysaccharide biosynthesis